MTLFCIKYFKIGMTSFRGRLGVYFQLLINSMSWFRYIDICSDDVIIVKVTMTRQTFQQLLNPEIDQIEVFGDICTGQVTT